MKIYTKTGDDGSTGVFAGPRVFKDDTRIQAFGSVDELNSVLGVVSSLANTSDSMRGVSTENSLLHIFHTVQNDLFAIGAELATPNPDAHGTRMISNQHIDRLERWIDYHESQLTGLTNFILPGGSPLAANLHWARTVCRRAERDVVHLMRQPDTVDCQQTVIYLNRLGDLLFVLARVANLWAGVVDIPWKKSTL